MIEFGKILPDKVPSNIIDLDKIRYFPGAPGTVPSESFFHVESLGHDQVPLLSVKHLMLIFINKFLSDMLVYILEFVKLNGIPFIHGREDRQP